MAQPSGEEGCGPRRLVRARDLQLAFEADLIGALDGRRPSARWCGKATADQLLAVVEDIAYALCTRRFYNVMPPIEGFWLRYEDKRYDRAPDVADMEHKLCVLSPYWRATAIGAALAVIGDENVCRAMSIDLEIATSPILRQFMKWRGTLEWMLGHLTGRDVRRLLARSVNWPTEVGERLYAATSEARRKGQYPDERVPALRIDQGFVWR